MLFQPTNITPSSFAGIGGDLVLNGQDMVVTWQINGTSPMIAYQITIYANTAASTQLYTTGKITLADPFYGVDGMGDVQLFSATISSASLSNAGVITGSATGYKYKITQWWDTNDFVEQSSENWFIIQNEPSVTIDTTTLSAPSASIAGSYAQAENVGLDWVRWVIELADAETNLSTGIVLLDSGKIHTQQLKYSYDGWISGTKYYVKLSYQLQNGYAGTASKTIPASWTQTDSRASVSAGLTDGCANVFIRYPIPTYAEITETPSAASVTGGNLVITSASETLEWNGGIMTASPAFGCLVWSGKPNGNVIVSMDGAFTTNSNTPYLSNTLQITLNASAGTLVWEAIGDGETETGTFTIGADMTGKMVTVIAGVGKWHVVVQMESDGETHTDLYDFESPLKAAVTIWDDNAVMTLAGKQECHYFGILSSDYSENTLNALMIGDGEQPEFSPEWLFLSSWEDDGYTVLGVMGQNTTDDTPETNSIIVYRRETGAPVMEKLLALYGQGNMLTTEIGKIIDYGVVSGKEYTYSVYYANEGGGTVSHAMIMRSGSVSPCYWDWILTTAEKSGDGTYRKTGSYRFGLSLETGAMSNNNAPALMSNFTRYPTRQGVSANYRTGSLTSFIGTVDKTANTYVDTEAQADAILAIGASTDAKFLRNRKGAKWMVDTSAATTVQTGDKYREQPYTVTLPWVETGSAENVPVISVPSDAWWKDPDSVEESPSTSDIITTQLIVTQNGVYTAPRGVAYTPVTVSIPAAAGGYF